MMFSIFWECHFIPGDKLVFFRRVETGNQYKLFHQGSCLKMGLEKYIKIHYTYHTHRARTVVMDSSDTGCRRTVAMPLIFFSDFQVEYRDPMVLLVVEIIIIDSRNVDLPSQWEFQDPKMELRWPNHDMKFMI